jgi:hypothetical protein
MFLPHKRHPYCWLADGQSRIGRFSAVPFRLKAFDECASRFVFAAQAVDEDDSRWASSFRSVCIA